MKSKHLIFITLIFFELSIARLAAQETILTTGGNTTTAEGSVSYSIGQVAYSSYIETSGSLLQGVQQPYEISVLTAIDNSLEKHISILVFPNPTVENLILRIERFEKSDLAYQFQDMSGKLFQKAKISNYETIVNMENLIPSTYFLSILDSDKVIKTFKVIKN